MSVERVRADPNWEPLDRYLVWLAKRAPHGLQRVRDAEKWTSGHFLKMDGSRCLQGHAEDWRLAPNMKAMLWEKQGRQLDISIPFDDLVSVHGLAPVVSAVQIRAAELLAEGGQP